MKPWYVQSNFVTYTGPEKLAEALKYEGIPFTDAPVMPFEVLKEWPEGDFIVYGSTRLVQYALEQKRGRVFYDGDLFNVKAWCANRSDMLNADATYCTAADVRRLAPRAARSAIEAGDDTHMFFRPLHDLKPFGAKVLSPEHYADPDKNLFGNFIVPDETPVAVSSAKRIDAEVRLFLVNGRIVSGSYYRKDGKQHHENIDAQPVFHEFEVLNWGRWIPNYNCVMDMALHQDKWYVLEFNCINASGFYDHDIRAIVRALSSQ